MDGWVNSSVTGHSSFVIRWQLQVDFDQPLFCLRYSNVTILAVSPDINTTLYTVL